MNSTSPTKKPGNRKYVESYDFRHPKLFSKEIMRTLRTIHDALARKLTRIFSSALRQKVEIYLHQIDQISSTEFIQNIDSPGVIYLLSMEEAAGEVIIVMPTPFSLYLIERQSGGKGDPFAEKRTLTTIEEKIVNRIMNNVIRELLTAWAPYKEFIIQKKLFESKSDNIHHISLDPTIVVRMKVETSDWGVEFYFSYPYGLLKEVMNDAALNRGSHLKAEQLSGVELEAYERTLKEANVLVQPLLGRSRLTIKELITLKEGDTLTLGQKTDKPLDVHINGVKKMTAFPGVIQGRRAVKIYELVEAINEQELL